MKPDLNAVNEEKLYNIINSVMFFNTFVPKRNKLLFKNTLPIKMFVRYKI